VFSPLGRRRFETVFVHVAESVLGRRRPPALRGRRGRRSGRQGNARVALAEAQAGKIVA